MTHSLTPVTWSGTRVPSGGGLTAPANFSAVGGDTVANLSWDTVSGATDYEVRVDAGSWISTSNTTSYQFTSLTNDQSYTFDVRATNVSEDGPLSTDTATPSEASGTAAYAPFDIEITQPRAGLDTTNRYYKQYTGIEYNVKTYVRGGDFSALVYSLTASPSGMTINPVTGVISWPNPIEAGSPHNITVSVTDGITSDSVSWTLAVDTSEALFVDSVNGSALGTGAIGDPMSDITDWYGSSKTNDTHAGKFVYYRTGTYNVDCIPKNEPTGGVTLSADKPTVHLAYPNESPVLDCAVGHWFCDSAFDNICFDGFEIVDVGAYVSPSGGEGVWFSRLAGSYHVYRRNTFSSINESTGPNNQAYIMAPFTRADYWGVSESYFDAQDKECYALGVFYDSHLAVIESNEIVNCIGIGVGFKTDNGSQSIRGNKASGVGGKLYDVLGFVGDAGSGFAELSWNYGDSENAFYMNEGFFGAPNDFYFIRNSSTAPFYIRTWDEPSYGDIYFTDNVVVSSTGELYTFESGRVVDEAKVFEDGNLINTTETNFIDTSTGLLIDSFESQNETKGHNSFGGLK